MVDPALVDDALDHRRRATEPGERRLVKGLPLETTPDRQTDRAQGLDERVVHVVRHREHRLHPDAEPIEQLEVRGRRQLRQGQQTMIDDVVAWSREEVVAEGPDAKAVERRHGRREVCLTVDRDPDGREPDLGAQADLGHVAGDPPIELRAGDEVGARYRRSRAADVG